MTRPLLSLRQQFTVSLTEDWQPLSVDELALQLQRCQQMAGQSPPSAQVALLTADDRRVWGKNRQALIDGQWLRTVIGISDHR